MVITQQIVLSKLFFHNHSEAYYAYYAWLAPYEANQAP